MGCFDHFYYILFPISLILALHFLLLTLSGLVLLVWEDRQGWRAERRVFQAGTKGKQSVGARSERDAREPQAEGLTEASAVPCLPPSRCSAALLAPGPGTHPLPSTALETRVIPENEGPGHSSGSQTISTQARGTGEGTNMGREKALSPEAGFDLSQVRDVHIRLGKKTSTAKRKFGHRGGSRQTG